MKRHKKKKSYDFKQKPWEPVKMSMFQVPNPFPDETSKEKRLEMIREIGRKAKKEFNEKYPSIENWFKEYDPLYILSSCSYYLMSYVEGTDPEATGSLKFHHHYLEIMQAFALYQKRNYSVKPLFQDVERLEKEMKEIGDLMSLRLMDIPLELESDSEINSFKLRTEMMMQTTVIRNWSYQHQIKRITLDLSKLIADDFKSVHNIDPTILISLLFDLADNREKLLNIHKNKISSFVRKKNYKEIIDEYNRVFPENERIEGDGVNAIWNNAGKNKLNLLGILMCHSDLKLEAIYSFSIDEAYHLLEEQVPMSILEDVINKLSYQFGDIEFQSFEKEHIILDNPVHHKPFIKVKSGTYYSSIWGILQHIILGILEDFIAVDDKLRERYNKIKSKYLEDEVENIFKSGFQHATIYRGSLWYDSESGKTYENDLIVLIDTFALVIEAKSGSVSAPARRGAPNSLFVALRKLIEEPSEQALRFINHLQTHRKVHTLKNNRGEKNVIDSTKIKYFIPLGVTFTDLGMISGNLKKLIQAGVVNKTMEHLAPSISFTDLELIFDLLTLEAEKVHYFARRREFESHVNYEGDEMDLLGLYLDNGFNIGEDEYNNDMYINMVLKSKELDPYFIGTNEGKQVTKPELAMTQLWKDLLNTLASRRLQNWIETSFTLLNTTIEDQQEFENKFETLKHLVRGDKAEKLHNWVEFFSGPERRRYLIVGYPYNTTDKNVRNNIMQNIFDKEEVKKVRGVVIIGVDVNSIDYPYSVLGSRLRTDLFDTLTL